MPDETRLHFLLTHAVTEYDRKESRKRFYNRYALALYLGTVHSALEQITAGQSPRAALCASFNGRLLDACLKAVGEPRSTRAEQLGL